MNILKRGSIGLLSIVCMLTIVGYINYEYNPDREKNLGKTVYVSTNQGEIIKVTNDKKEEGAKANDNFLYVNSTNITNAKNIEQNISMLKSQMESRGYNIFATYNFENGKYYVFTDYKDLELIKKEVESVLNIEGDKIIVNNY